MLFEQGHRVQSEGPEKAHVKHFEYLTPLFNLLVLVIESRITPRWSTTKDEENSVQSGQEYDSQGNNLEGGLSS